MDIKVFYIYCQMFEEMFPWLNLMFKKGNLVKFKLDLYNLIRVKTILEKLILLKPEKHYY